MPMNESRRWLTLAIVGAAFFMTVLDVAIVNVALPSIEDDLNVTETTVQWVLIAYAITFGGFLLLGGRMADLLGRKRIFLVGLVLFTLASLVCGLANDIGVLIGGILVKYLGWEWIFYVNVPVGALVLGLTLPFVPESRADLGHRRFDAAGAVTATGGLALLVFRS